MIYLDDRTYNWDDLTSLIKYLEEVPKSSKWHTDLHSFLSDWIDDRDYVCFYTSGSTGTPKEIRHSKKSMIKSASNTLAFFAFESGQNALLCLPPNFVAGAMMIVRSIVGNLNLYCQEPSGTPNFSGLPYIDFAAMTPFQVDNCLSIETGYFSMVGHLIIGGAPTPDRLHKLLRQINTKCYQTFGMTETITHIALKCLNGVAESTDYIALNGVHFFKTEDNTLGIHADYIDSSPLVTNDLVDLIDKRRFRWLGRADNVINSGGVKIIPEHVEAKLASAIQSRFFITSEPDDKLGNRVVLLIESSAEGDDLLRLLYERMKELLNQYEIPKQVYFYTNFLETETGKIKRDIELYDIN